MQPGLLETLPPQATYRGRARLAAAAAVVALALLLLKGLRPAAA
jgi:hypothetical protein